MGLLERALSGLGKGLADAGEWQLKAQIEEQRAERLAELQAARDDRRYARERTDKLSDFERQKEWELEKMGTEYGYKAQLKGIRGGLGGGGSILRDAEGNPVLDDDGDPIRVPASGGRGGKKGSEDSGGDAPFKANGALVNLPPEDGGGTGVLNPRTGEVRPTRIRVDAPLEAGQHGPPEKDPRYKQVALDTKVGTEKSTESATAKKRWRWGSLALDDSGVLSLMDKYNESVPPSKQITDPDQFMKLKGITSVEDGASPGLLGGRPAAEMRDAERRSTPPRSAQGRPAPRGPAPTKAPPVPGEVRNGFRFLGGNPNDKASWVPVQ